MTAAPPASREKRAALPRELHELLVGLSIAVHRFAMYPPDHPSLEPAAENVRSGLALLLQDTETLSIGTAQKQLVVEGVATDPNHPVLTDLARRLHAHHLGALIFTNGVTRMELEGLLSALADDPERAGASIGLLSPGQLPVWDHIRLRPVGYDRMRLGEGKGAAGDSDRPLQLWLALAQASLTGEEDVSDPAALDGSALARLVEGYGKEAKRDGEIIESLMQLAAELRSTVDAGATTIRDRVSELVRTLDPATLRRLLASVGSAAKRKRFVLDCSQALAADAVVEVLQAAAAASGQTISNSLTRLLSKLAIHAEQGSPQARTLADAALRENVEALITEWELADPNPESYTLLLDAMAGSAPIFTPPKTEHQNVPGATRILQTALEIDAFGPTLEKAVSDLLEEGRIGFILETLDRAPEGSGVAEKLRARLTTPYQLEKLLESGEVDEENLNALVSRLGPIAVDTLLEFLTESESRGTRRKVFDCLVRMGPVAGEKALRWLDDPRWFVQRNMLALLHGMDPLPEGFLPEPYLTHADARVRREGFPLALRIPRFREKALAVALGDSDERLVRMALLELRSEVPETLVPTLVTRMIDSEGLQALRPMGIRALRGSTSALALEALLRACAPGRTLLGRRKLAEKSPAMLAALSVLADNWSGEDQAARVLKRAQASKDPEIREAATPDGSARSSAAEGGLGGAS